MVECYIDDFGRRVCYQSAWESWARWLFLGLTVLFFFLVFFFFSCISARRRRRRGQIPFRGTGWLSNHGPAVYNPNPYPPGGSTTTGPTTTSGTTTTGGYNQNAAQRPVPQTGAAASYYAQYAPPPPMYTPSQNPDQGTFSPGMTTGTTGTTGYNEQQHSGIELTGPQPVYGAK